MTEKNRLRRFSFYVKRLVTVMLTLTLVLPVTAVPAVSVAADSQYPEDPEARLL